MNALDKVILYLSPEAAARRMRFRLLHENLRKYDGATMGRRGDGWLVSGASASAEIGNSLDILRNRSRDLVRNNEYAEKGIRFIAAVTIGTGIIPESRHPNPEMAKKIEAWWEEWAATPKCDLAGKLDFYGLQTLTMRSVSEAGEGLIRRVRVRDYKWPTRLQILEPDHIATDKCEELKNGGRILHGVELDANGAWVALWIYERHPGDILFTRDKAVRVDAKDLCHPFRMDRASQLRGVPWLAPVMLRLRDFGDYVDAQLMRQKIAACWSVFIHDIEEPEDSPGASARGSTKADPLVDKVTPGLVQVLPNGKTVSFASPPGVQNYGEYSSITLHGIAAGLGITYEALTSDLKGVNFSSGRMGKIDQDRLIKQYQYQMMIPQVCDRTWEWFMDDLVATGKIRERDRTGAYWTPPRRELVDPTREIPAMEKGIRAGVITLSSAIREQGDDPKKVFEERARDDAELDRLGIKLSSDPRQDSHHVQKLDENNSEGEDDAATDPLDSED